MKLLSNKLFAFAIGICITGSLFAQETKEESTTTFTFGGFAKTDFMFTQYNNGPSVGAGRDFHIPGTIPVGGIDVYNYTDFHVKESRFNFDVSTLVGGKKLRAFVEMDFMLSEQGDERVSNSCSPRMRHFYLEYDKLLVGQTWSTFMIVTLPDELDFIGAAEGVVFVRQPQARITLGTWQFAIENPQTTYTPYQASNREVSESGLVPDVVARKNFKFGIGHLSIAAIGRLLHYAEADKTEHRTIGTGATVGGMLKIGKRDDIRFTITSGIGLGRYIALNFINAATINSSQDLIPRFSHNEYISYLHYWSSKLRSSFSASYFTSSYDNSMIDGAANYEALSLSGNLIYSPAEKLLFGVEPIYGTRKTVDGTKGDFVRIQFSARYAFSFRTSISN